MRYDTKKLIDSLDYEKIRAYMVLTNWTYRGNKESPTVDELKTLAYYHLEQVEKSMVKHPKKDTFSRSGGLKVSYYADMGEMHLEFIITNSSMKI